MHKYSKTVAIIGTGHGWILLASYNYGHHFWQKITQQLKGPKSFHSESGSLSSNLNLTENCTTIKKPRSY